MKKLPTLLFATGCLFIALAVSLGIYTRLVHPHTENTAPIALAVVALLALQASKIIDKHDKGAA